MEELYLKTLKQYGLSNTQKRRIVFNYFLQTDKSVSMNELIKSMHPIDRVSIYRIIDQFERVGIVRRIQVGWKYKIELGEKFHYHHHHMTCTSCGVTYDFDEPLQLEKMLENVTKEHHFNLQEHILELRGICSNCKAKP